ncbi:gluconokinase [Sporomusa sp.]|uniref:gluconokinase n=1 Tax=Sporomusa sp. TaxID=2078658 RepID=UPI002CD0FC4B|nr:gluconokinase [Sporomusa sp.]HWR42921.1 gluconokinase [Sporomusa sp.]
MNSQAIIGVDIGTTGCRAVIYRQDGMVVANHSLEYPLYTPQAAWAEQDPEEIFQAVVKVTKRATEEARTAGQAIAGVCFSAVMHSLIPVDAGGMPLYRMLIWADSRSQQYTEKLKAEYDANEIYQKTGCPMHPMYPLSKVLWFKHEQPEIFARTSKLIGIKEYVLYRLTGRYVMDKSLASATAIYNIHKQEWDAELLAILGISSDLLPEVKPTTHIERGMKPEQAEALGVDKDIPLILGASDGVLSTLGSGTVNPGQVTAMIGTSGAVRVVTDKPQSDDKRRTWCYNLTEDKWVLGGALSNGGIAFRWARDKFAGSEQRVAEKLGLDTYEILSRYAEQKPAGSDGLVMLPFFSGERAPYYNANARGVLFGLNLNHGKRHLVRATLEGIVYRMFSIFKSLEEVSGNVTEIRASGSFTRSSLWVQIMADVFGRVITVPGEPEGSAFGAAILGMYALGIIGDIKEVNNFINIKERYQPNMENHARYQELYAIYERIYWNLQNEFEAIAEIQRRWK